jgi:hypothetical protein
VAAWLFVTGVMSHVFLVAANEIQPLGSRYLAVRDALGEVARGGFERTAAPWARPRLLRRRLLRVRGPSADRPVDLDFRIPSAYLGGQVEFITCRVGDTTHSGCHNLLVCASGASGPPSAA